MTSLNERIAAMRARDKARSDAIKRQIEEWIDAPGVDFDTFPKYTRADIEGTSQYAFRQAKETWGVILEPATKLAERWAEWLIEKPIRGYLYGVFVILLVNVVLAWGFFGDDDNDTAGYILLLVLSVGSLAWWTRDYRKTMRER